MKTLPQTLETCQAELTRIYKKKRIANKTLLIFMLLLIAFAVGAMVGQHIGYHECLVDFKIIAGTVI